MWYLCEVKLHFCSFRSNHLLNIFVFDVLFTQEMFQRTRCKAAATQPFQSGGRPHRSAPTAPNWDPGRWAAALPGRGVSQAASAGAGDAEGRSCCTGHLRCVGIERGYFLNPFHYPKVSSPTADQDVFEAFIRCLNTGYIKICHSIIISFHLDWHTFVSRDTTAQNCKLLIMQSNCYCVHWNIYLWQSWAGLQTSPWSELQVPGWEF